MNTANFNDSGLGGKNLKTTETVHYLGELRIVGQVVENMLDKQPIGYVVMTERTQKFKMYTIDQTKSLLSKFKFVNAELKDGNIVNTECAMSRMPKYFPNMTVADNNGVIILGEIIDKDKVLGYRALDTKGRIVDLEENDLIALSNTGIDIINAKIVNRNNKTYLSAIKTEFTKIEKSKIKELKPRESKGFIWRKKMHVKKWLDYGALKALRAAILSNGAVVNDTMYSRHPDKVSFGRGYFDIKRESVILAKEVFTKQNGAQLSAADAELYKRILKEVPHQQIVGYDKKGNFINLSGDDSFFIVLITQFILNSPEHRRKLVNQVSYSGIRDRKFIDKVLNSGYACKAFKDTIKEIEKTHNQIWDSRRSNSLSEKEIKAMFKTKEFVQALDIAQLGFAITESNRGYRFETQTGSYKTLLYLGDVIGENYNKYKEKSRCLGDLAAIAYIYKLMTKVDSYYMKKEDIIAVIEMLIAISFVFNSTAMDAFVCDNVERLDEIGVLIPDWDEVAGIDYKLPVEIKMYYASGFNVFLSDNQFLRKPYHHKHLRCAELINYRQLGISHNIVHPMLKRELAPIVNMVTSDNCEAEKIDELIGQLRYL